MSITQAIMPAYIIFTRVKTTKQSELDTYSQLLPAITEGVNFKVLSAYGKQNVLEGPPVEGAVILEFPSFKDAEEWYHGQRYQEIVHHRFNGAVYTAIIVEGFNAKQ